MGEVSQIRPMLAASKWNEAHIEMHLREAGFLYIQPKIDGMRVLFNGDGTARSRSWKLHGNKALQRFAKDNWRWLAGTDGEVLPGHIYTPEVFRQAMSDTRAAEGSPDMTVYFFDRFDPEHIGRTYDVRRALLENMLKQQPETVISSSGERDIYSVRLVLCPQKQVSTLEEIYEEELRLLAAGWEGAILRRNDRPYKYNRATSLGGNLMKLKRMESAEAIVTGFEPWMENQNDAVTSELGFTTRSAHQENLEAKERLGSLICYRADKPDVSFKIGVFLGLTHTDRDNLWAERDSLVGRICEFKHQGYGGGYDAPRTPVWLRWRDAAEM